MTTFLLRAALAVALGALPAAAQQTWTFDQTTTGGDIHYTSPTSVNPAAVGYVADYQLALVEVKVKYLGITFGPFDVTGQIPPEFQTGSGSSAGPAPITLFSQPVAYPDPPAAPSLAANLAVSLDAAGFGHVDATGVVLGTILVDLGFFGTVNAQITSLRIKGSVTVDETQWVDLGLGLAGSAVEPPALWGTGDLAAGTPLSVALSGALANSSATLLAGFANLSLPFKGGTLVPSVDVLVLGLPMGPGGGITLGSTWPAGIPAGFKVYLQAWVVDPAGPQGLSASNGLSGTAQ